MEESCRLPPEGGGQEEGHACRGSKVGAAAPRYLESALRRAEALHFPSPAWVPLPLSVLASHFGSWFLLFSVPISFSLAYFLRSHLGRRETLG